MGVTMLKKRKIVISGAGGNIGKLLITKILKETNWEIFAFSSSLKENLINNNRLFIYKNDELKEVLHNIKEVDTCIHLAFSRRFNTNTEIAQSLDFTLKFLKAARFTGSRIINMSTVGVYGLRSDFPDENTPPSPEDLYSMAKYASETILDSISFNYEKDVTNIRLSGIAQSQRVLPIFIEKAKNNSSIEIKGGEQEFSWLDMSDAVDALIALISYEKKWARHYNVSLNKKRYSILELAEMVSHIAEINGYLKTPILISPTTDKRICVGWNSERFIRDTGWSPKIDIFETIKSMFRY